MQKILIIMWDFLKNTYVINMYIKRVVSHLSIYSYISFYILRRKKILIHIKVREDIFLCF